MSSKTQLHKQIHFTDGGELQHIVTHFAKPKPKSDLSFLKRS